MGDTASVDLTMASARVTEVCGTNLCKIRLRNVSSCKVAKAVDDRTAKNAGLCLRHTANVQFAVQ